MTTLLRSHYQQRQHYLIFSLLMLSSALSVTLLAVRIWYAGTRYYVFLNWNLMLAWAPLILAFVLWRLDQSQARRPTLIMAVVFGGWLLFLPNSPYIVSDLMHLNHRDRVPLWYDAIMLFSFAWNGLILGFVSLSIVQQLTARWFGQVAGWILVALTLMATGFGIYLGRFGRWNSWDVLVDPFGLLRQVLHFAMNPIEYRQTIGVTLLFAGFLIVAYLTVTLLPGAMKGLAVESESR